MNALNTFFCICGEEFPKYLNAIKEDELYAAADLICEAEKAGGRLHVTGIGKPAHVAGYVASLISSTGTPAYFLHGTEAVHGSCGQLAKGDVVICISNSGETAELKATAIAARNNGAKLIAVTGKPESWLAKFCEVHIFAGVEREGGPLARAPRMSVIAECLALQALSVILQERKQQTVEEYLIRHPGGTLGQSGNK